MKVLLLNQCFYPDVVSTAQHLTDLALKLAGEGHDVTVVASSRGYDDTAARFSGKEVWKGIKIIRLPVTGLGKQAKWRRAVDFGSFFLSAISRLIFLRKFDLVLAMTSPPLISFLGALFVRLKGGRFVFWVMDLNPDEAIAAGWLKEGTMTAKALKALLAYSLRRAEKIFVLDRFMKKRIREKGVEEQKIAVIPPWSHDHAIRFDPEGRKLFRAEHGLSDKFVVMYSGNHSPCHPLDTLLEAAQRLVSDDKTIFCFIGGGSEYQKVKAFACEHSLKNILCLPYQPLSKLSASLSAADLQVVVMGEPFAGIVHPCKIYNILAIGTPFLYIGPAESHVSDIVLRLDQGVLAGSASHGDVDAVVRIILERTSLSTGSSSHASSKAAAEFSIEALLPQMIEALQSSETPASLYGTGRIETDVRSA